MFTIVGGVWAVVLMDAIQFVILIFASLIMVPLSLDAAGGLGNLMERQPDHFNFLNGPNGNLFWIFVYFLLISLKYNGNWAFIQRFYSVKDEASSKKLGYFTAILFFVFPIFFLLPAIAASGNQIEAVATFTAFDPRELETDTSSDRGFLNLNRNAFLSVLQVNTMGTVIPCQVFAKDMAQHGGNVPNL